jgi:hypothetical protein
MYITGNQLTFENRLHQFATGESELTSYVNEGNNYLTGNFNRQQSGKWEKEARIQKFRFTKLPGALISGLFGASALPDSPAPSLDEIGYTQSSQSFYFFYGNPADYSTYNMFVSTTNAYAGISGADIYSVRGDGEWYPTYALYPNLAPNGESNYYYYIEARGLGPTYNTNIVRSNIYGPINVVF